MGLVANTAEFFLLSLALGLGLFSALVDLKETGVGFLRVNNGVCIGALTLAFFLHFLGRQSLNIWPFDTSSILYLLAIFIFIGVHFLHKDIKSPGMWGLYGLHNFCTLGLLFFFFNSLTLFALFLTSSLYLGVITFSMVLGHWYLVTPHLSERPLKKAMILLWIILGIKLLILIHTLSSAHNFFTVGTVLGGGYSFNWLMLLMRVGQGHIIIAVMSVLTWKLIKMRSLQSATGILYVMTFFVFIGELISTYFFYKYGLFL